MAREPVRVLEGVLYRADGSAASVDRLEDRAAIAAAFQRYRAGTLDDGDYDLVTGDGKPRLEPAEETQDAGK